MSLPRFFSGGVFWILCVVLAFALRTSAESLNSAEAKVVVGSPADWIKPLVFQRLPKERKVDPAEPWRSLLQERQIHAEKKERFFHTASQILTSAGVQYGSDISISFDPSYESLTLHWVKIWRNTNAFDRLDREKIKIIQQERELDRHIYDGRQSAVLLLEDVRVGDIIEYAYTVHGENPVFGGKFFDSISMQSTVPMERVFARLIWTLPQRRFYVKNQETAAKPIVTRSGDVIEFIWEGRNVPAIREESSTPSWHPTEGWIQLSEFRTWAELNQWALALFENKEPLCVELKQLIEKWKWIPTREERAQKALQFVQDEIRYLGIEMGANGHQPHGVNSVFARRFGDCKDKTLLLVNILRALDIEAYPVFVDTRFRHRVENWQPSAIIFDHVIAQIRIGAQVYWADATANYQRGPLSARYFPNYGRGLVIRSGTTALTTIESKSGWPLETVTEKFTVRGKNDPANLEIVTVAEGLEAERFRMQFATVSRGEIEEDYLKYYATLYPKIRQTRALEFKDDEKQNRIEIREFYSMENFWEKSDEDRKYWCSFAPYSISALVRKPFTKGRSAPLALPFPKSQIVRTEISLPSSWPVSNENKTVAGQHFFYRRNVNNFGRRCIIEHEYRSLTETVSTNQLNVYLQQLDDASEKMRNTLIWN